MAKTMFANLNAIVANTLTDSIKMIDIDELYESEDNFFDVNRVDEFADTILSQGGVKDNLIVRPLDTGGYEIISGHRRRAAVQLLLDRGENISRLLPCLVQRYEDEESKLLDIVLMNISARQISDAEMWKSYEIVDSILKSKKSTGEKFGRVREKLAELLGVSPAQVGKMQNVEKNAIEPVKDAVKTGEISISTANEIAKLDADEQEQLAQANLRSVTHKAVREKQPKPVNAAMPEKVDTCINFSADDDDSADEPEPEVDTYSTFSSAHNTDAEESSDEPIEKVDTCINFSEEQSDNSTAKHDNINAEFLIDAMLGCDTAELSDILNMDEMSIAAGLQELSKIIGLKS